MTSPGLFKTQPSVTSLDFARWSTARSSGPPQLLHLDRQVLGCKRRRLSPHQQRAPVPRVSTLQTSPESNTSANVLVDDLLQEIKGTDSGEELSQAKRQTIDSLILQLQAIGEQQQPRPLENELIWGNYNVSYVSTQQAPNQKGQPAGGIFRTGPAKLIFQTTLLAQSILKPDLVTNKVGFKLLGFIPGFVGLRGKLKPVENGKDTVRVDFEPSEICIAGDSLRVGPSSDVTLKTTFLDERVRLGQGSRGSLFVFTRGGPSDAAGMDKVGVTQRLRKRTASIQLRNIAVAALLGMGAFIGWQQSSVLSQTFQWGSSPEVGRLTHWLWGFREQRCAERRFSARKVRSKRVRHLASRKLVSVAVRLVSEPCASWLGSPKSSFGLSDEDWGSPA
ncbi:hypothetical protein WJX74_010715 [Apatococcus lobatus]|uniref:Plastid lipid-associated protein/fibrillin conserved domain-containing protein n=1 Tax=Apatococcus lobatus TaxID=904363 RepID=A0AAW1Q3J5_9CHLO